LKHSDNTNYEYSIKKNYKKLKNKTKENQPIKIKNSNSLQKYITNITTNLIKSNSPQNPKQSLQNSFTQNP